MSIKISKIIICRSLTFGDYVPVSSMIKYKFYSNSARVNSITISLNSFTLKSKQESNLTVLTWKITNWFDSELDLPYFYTFLCIIWLQIGDQGNKSHIYIGIYVWGWLCGCMCFNNSKSFLFFIKTWERIKAQMGKKKHCIKLWLIPFNSVGIIFPK